MDAKDLKINTRVKVVDGNSIYAGRIGSVKNAANGIATVDLDTEDDKFKAVTSTFAAEDLSMNMDDEVVGSTAEGFKGVPGTPPTTDDK